MSNILSNKKGLILGVLDERSLAWHVAKRCQEEGAAIVLSNTEAALKLGSVGQLSREYDIPFVACDMTKDDEVTHLLTKAQELLGGQIDFVLHAVAQSQNLRRHKAYDQLSYEYFHRTLDISALSLHRLLQTAMETDAISTGGSVVALTYIASERFVAGYGDMADAKAMLDSIVRQMGAVYGMRNKVRVNAVSQSLTPTKASAQWSAQQDYYRFLQALSPLGMADADDCADLCVALFSDLTRKVTMQTIYNDGGNSRTMMTESMATMFSGLIDKAENR